METVTTPVFSVKTDSFEGPLELLIELVEKRKLLINNISLAEVTDEYMSRVRDMQEQSLPHTAQFVALAATLLLIKSKSLLPTLDLSGEEEASIGDLEERLKRYQIYRQIGAGLQEQFGKQVMYEPEYRPSREPLFLPDVYCTLDSLRTALHSVITNLPQPKTKRQKAAVKKTISLDEMMATLNERIQRQFKFSFFDIKREHVEHKTVIVGFLAILELFKQGDLLVTQLNRFADIAVERERSETPRYY
jgi:segregation and condensation protein A